MLEFESEDDNEEDKEELVESEEEEWKAEIEREAEKENKTPKRNIGSIKELLTIGARFGDGPQKMAAYANAVHEDDGVNLTENLSKIVTSSICEKETTNQSFQ